MLSAPPPAARAASRAARSPSPPTPTTCSTGWPARRAPGPRSARRPGRRPRESRIRPAAAPASDSLLPLLDEPRTRARPRPSRRAPVREGSVDRPLRPDRAGHRAHAPPRPPTPPVAARLIAAAGALALLLSLFAQWGFDRSVVPNVPLSAWEVYARTDVLLAALAILAAAGARSATRRYRRPDHHRRRGGGRARRPAPLQRRRSRTRRQARPPVGRRRRRRGRGAPDRPRGAARAAPGAACAPSAHRIARVVGSTWILGPVLAYVTFPLRTLAHRAAGPTARG